MLDFVVAREFRYVAWQQTDYNNLILDRKVQLPETAFQNGARDRWNIKNKTIVRKHTGLHIFLNIPMIRTDDCSSLGVQLRRWFLELLREDPRYLIRLIPAQENDENNLILPLIRSFR